MRENFYENEYARFWLQDDWMVCVQYKPKLVIDLKVAKLCTEIRRSIHNGRVLPMFTDGRNIKTINFEARNYLAEHGTSLVTAGAFLIETQIEKFIGSVFFRINKPPVPSKMFTSEKEALKWLEEYKPAM